MISSGTASVATAGDASVVLIAGGSGIVRRVVLANEGAAPGFFSIDNGTTWGRLSAGVTLELEFKETPIALTNGVLVKRVAGGTDLSNVFGFAI